MPSVSRLLVVGGIVLLLGVIIMFPARVAHHWFSPAAVQVAGIDGTVWSGSAREASAHGVYLRNLHWKMQPLRLLLGQVAYYVEADPAGGFLETDVSVGLTGTVRLRNTRAALPLTALHGALRIDDIGGDISLQLSEARLSDGWPEQLEGTVGISGLLVRALAPSPLGNFTAEFQSNDDDIVGSVEDVSGMLDVAGIVTLKPDRSYSLIGQVAATAEAPASLTQQLQYLGSANARGLRDFRLEGTL